MLLKSEVLRLRAAKQFARQPYTWPGMYPLAAIMADGGCLCAACIRKEWSLIVSESMENTNCGFRIAGVDVNYENHDLCCDHCSGRIESAYEEDEA